jgi:hypothetical protein
MAHHAYCSHLAGTPCHAAKCQRAINSWWMHLGAAEISMWHKIQRCWAQHAVATTNSLFLAGYALALRAVLVGPLPAATQGMINYLLQQASLFAQQVTLWSSMDGLLYDIPLVEWLYTREYCPRQHLRILGITNDMTAVKMTIFKISQLQQLFHLFGPRKFVNAHNETDLLIGTGCWRNGRECCYCTHPGELFRFLLAKCKTGTTTDNLIDMFFGGDYSRWKYGYCWILLYLDLRFHNIVGHVGLLCFLPQFGKFKNVIEECCQKEHMYHNHQGNVTFIPGLSELPYNIFGFIDNSIDRVCVPFLGPDGDYKSAPR